MEAHKETAKPRLKLPEVNHKLLMLIPLIMIIASAGYVIWLSFGPGLALDIDLKGGTQITADSASAPDTAAIESSLKDFGANVRSARSMTGWTVIIEVPADANTDNVLNVLKNAGWEYSNLSVQTIGPALGASFFKQAQIALIAAFIAMSITIFIVFRTPMPSLYVVLCGAADITTALAASQLLGINLSLATFSALLMLVGYSVDTDVLLTSRVLKGTEGDFKERSRGAMRTGLTMTGSAIVALAALYLISSSIVITQIASVLMLGLLADIPYTWIMNSGLLRWYVDRKAKRAVA